MLRHLDLFSGIGGFSLAARWAYGDEHKPIAFCEIDKYCQKVLKKHWPDVPIFEDIRSLDGRQFRDVDLVSGGFPCQPFSVAGKRKGKEDDRHLWPEYLRIIQQARPRWVVGENVPGIIHMELDTVLSDLEREDYVCQTLIIPACALNAQHRRDRVWIVAHSVAAGERWTERQEQTETDASDPGLQRQARPEQQTAGLEQRGEDVANAETIRTQRVRPSGEQEPETHGGQEISLCCSFGNDGNATGQGLPNWAGGEMGQPFLLTEFERSGGREIERDFRGMAHGVSKRVDRLKALGNAIVPQVAYELLRMIKAIDEQEKARENVAVGCSPADA